jgi:hypothetical protein
MKNRKQTPDVLGSIMLGDKEKKPNLQEEETTPDVRIVQNIVERQQQRVFASKETKEKATFNLPKKLLQELEEKWVDIRRLSGSKQVSKTLMIEKALELVFKDFEVNREYSKFYGVLLDNIAIKQ